MTLIDIDQSADALSENSVLGSASGIIANLSGSSGDVVYSLADDAGGRFAINAATGVVSLAGGLDFETAASHLITVRASSSDGTVVTQDFIIGVLDHSPVIMDASGDGAGTVTGGNENEQLFGMGGNDVLIGGRFADVLDGGAGIDFASYQTASAGITFNLTNWANTTGDAAGDSFISIERFRLTEYADVLIGSELNDYVNGGSGDDVMDGAEGHDVLIGGGGADQMSGGYGNDLFYVDNAADQTVEYANQGNDRLISSIDYALGAGQSIESLEAQAGSSNIWLIGNELANIVVGNNGDNGLFGGLMNDSLRGGAGDDNLSGEGGIDVLEGGAGSDTFVLPHLSENRDRIVDFISGEDLFELSATDFGLAAGSLANEAFAVNTTGLADDADDRIVYNSVNGVLYFDADGSGAGLRQAIALFNSAVTLAASDFVICDHAIA
jgi:Ca2+-binding RTX toxin-like protein